MREPQGVVFGTATALPEGYEEPGEQNAGTLCRAAAAAQAEDFGRVGGILQERVREAARHGKAA